VKEVEAKAAVITLAADVDAVLKASELSREKVEDARNLLKVGDEVEAKIIAVDRKNRSISLSVKSKDVEDEKAAIKELSTKQTEAAPTTLGDLIKAQMQNKE
jgi:small subunit ribosomal protein S1